MKKRPDSSPPTTTARNYGAWYRDRKGPESGLSPYHFANASVLSHRHSARKNAPSSARERVFQHGGGRASCRGHYFRTGEASRLSWVSEIRYWRGTPHPPSGKALYNNAVSSSVNGFFLFPLFFLFFFDRDVATFSDKYGFDGQFIRSATFAPTPPARNDQSCRKRSLSPRASFRRYRRFSHIATAFFFHRKHRRSRFP